MLLDIKLILRVMGPLRGREAAHEPSGQCNACHHSRPTAAAYQAIDGGYSATEGRTGRHVCAQRRP